MKKRIITALLIVPPVLITVAYAPILVIKIVSFIAGLIAIDEFHGLIKKTDKIYWIYSLFAFSMVFWLAAERADLFGPAILMTFIMLLLIPLLTKNDINYDFTHVAGSWLAITYVSLYSFFYIMIRLPKGRGMLITIFFMVWITDSTAMLFCKFFGKRKLSPVISPHKTVEGFAAGAVASIVTSLSIGQFFNLFSTTDAVAIGLIVGIAGQAGDLIESTFKRYAGKKDSGKLFPGHGGVLDRLDSLAISVALSYLYITLVS